MSLLPTTVDTHSAEFQQNTAAMRRLLEEFETRQQQARQGGSERARQRHIARGKLLPRERVELLLDPGTPFLELSTLAGWDMYNNESPAGSGINGIGVVNGVECMVSANDATAKGGASYPISVKKALRAQEIAATNHLPCVYLVESAGAPSPTRRACRRRASRRSRWSLATRPLAAPMCPVSPTTPCW